MLTGKHLTKKFGGVTALSDVSFSLQKGEILGLIGPNGAGKSSLINVITGLYTPDSGSLELNHTDLIPVSPHKRVQKGLARTFQNVRLFGDLTVLENILIGQHHLASSAALGSRRSRERELREQAEGLIKDFELTMRRDHDCASLPLGIQRRVEIARALATGAELLLLDEPTSGMLASEQVELSKEFLRLKQQGKTIILIEHNMSVVMPISDRVMVLNFGMKIAEGAPEEIQRHPAVLEAYLGQ
jgi:branched-chain amino acid transport system ATP-binding protein